jgi:hypothetical protein
MAMLSPGSSSAVSGALLERLGVIATVSGDGG